MEEKTTFRREVKAYGLLARKFLSTDHKGLSHQELDTVGMEMDLAGYKILLTVVSDMVMCLENIKTLFPPGPEAETSEWEGHWARCRVVQGVLDEMNFIDHWRMRVCSYTQTMHQMIDARQN